MATSQPVAERQPKPVGRGLEDLGLQRVTVAQIGDHHHRYVEFAADQQVLEVIAIVLDRRDVDTGIGASEAGQQVAQHIAGDQRGDAERQMAWRRGRFVGNKASPRILHVGQDARGMPVELVALVGDVEAARMALEQFHAEIALQFLHGLGDGGLRD